MMQIPSVSPTVATASDKQHKQLQSACQQFEGYFLDLMFKEMRKTVPQSGLLDDQSDQQQIFTGMMDQTLADTMSKRGDLGISQMLYSQLAPALGADAVSPPQPKAEPASGQ